MSKHSGGSRANAVRIIVSLIYVILGASSVFTALKSLLNLELAGLLTSAVGVIMFIAGVLGLFKTHPAVYRFFGIIIFAVSAFNFVWTLVKGGSFDNTVLTQALLAWLFIICV